MIRHAARTVTILFVLIAARPALAVPTEVAYTADDGSAFGQFAFEPVPVDQNPGRLTSGRLQIGEHSFDHSQLFYEYYGIADSLQVHIRGNELTGLPRGDYLNLQFGNPDGSALSLPTRGVLNYNLGGVDESKTGMVTDVPEPTAAGLFGLGAVGLAWRRRRRR
jgi:PEP-CTERM motif